MGSRFLILYCKGALVTCVGSAMLVLALVVFTLSLSTLCKSTDDSTSHRIDYEQMCCCSWRPFGAYCAGSTCSVEEADRYSWREHWKLQELSVFGIWRILTLLGMVLWTLLFSAYLIRKIPQ
ncbi:MAG: hypothetical protein KDD62_11410 [Bdellovibrionales bacterium]|nr:hypothetical protein [Bdellovibrionales bacterium]